MLGTGHLGNFILGSTNLDEEIIYTASETIVVTDESDASLVHTHLGNSGDTLTLTQKSRSGLIKETVGHNLTSGSLVVDPITLETTLVLDQHSLRDGSSCQLVSGRTAGDIISLGQKSIGYVVHADAIDCMAGETVDVTDGSNTDVPLEAGETIDVTDGCSAVVGNAKAGDTLSVVDGASVAIVRPVSSGDTLNVGQGTTYTLIKSCTVRKYSPFVGGSDTGPDAPPTSLPSASVTTGFRLQWPATGTVTDELILPNPNLGNSQRITKSRISRESRGGTLIVYSDPIWPKFDSLVVSISYLTAAQKEAILTFTSTHLGQKVKLIDWENREWVGLVLPGDLIAEDRHNSFTAAFEFEGERVLS